MTYNKFLKCSRFLKVIRLVSKVTILCSSNPLILLGYWTIVIQTLLPIYLLALVYVRPPVKATMSKVGITKVKVKRRSDLGQKKIRSRLQFNVWVYNALLVHHHTVTNVKVRVIRLSFFTISTRSWCSCDKLLFEAVPVGLLSACVFFMFFVCMIYHFSSKVVYDFQTVYLNTKREFRALS